MKINYPIKYTAMPIIEQVGWSHGLNELERNYDIVCYIVSKCYLLNDLTKYREDGRSIKEYEVVFPYQLGEYSNWERIIPSFNMFNGNCINSNSVDLVFDSYEEALKYATIKNEKLCEETWKYLPYSESLAKQIQEKKDEFNDRLSNYKMLEQQILVHTNDLSIGKTKDVSQVIGFKHNSGKILSCNLYDVIQSFDAIEFIAYTVTPEQYDKLIELIKSNNSLDYVKTILGHTDCLLTHASKDSLISIVHADIDGRYYIGEDKSLHYDNKFKKINPDEFDNVDEDIYVLYTTETLEDVMASYKQHEEITLSKVQGPVKKLNRN